LEPEAGITLVDANNYCIIASLRKILKKTPLHLNLELPYGLDPVIGHPHLTGRFQMLASGGSSTAL
jgi:hypothetical protein